MKEQRKTRNETAESLIKSHFEVEPELTSVWWMNPEDEDDERIALLEVSNAALPTNSFYAFSFSATADIPYRMVLAEVGPEDFETYRTHPHRMEWQWKRFENAREYARAEFYG